MDQLPEPGYALFSISEHSVRRSLIAWGAFAIGLFVLAAVITWIVIGVKHAPIDDAHTLRVEFLYPNTELRPVSQALTPSAPIDRARLTKLGTYSQAEYREELGKSTLDLWYPPGIAGRVLVSHLSSPSACQEVLFGPLDQSRATLDTAQIPATDTNFHDDWILTLNPVRPHDPLVYDSANQVWSLGQNETEVHVRCDLRHVADRETFISKRLLITARDATGLGSYMSYYTAAPYVYVRIPLIGGVESIQFSGGYSWMGNSSVESPESERGVKLGSQVEVRWREADREGERDALFVVIGALIALGAAMMVEAVRPAVDRYIEARQAAKESSGS